jgi:hypothetical protein
VTQPIRDYVGLLLSSAYGTRSATAEQGLANFLFRGAYTPGVDSTTFKLMRLQGAKVYPKFEDILAQDGIRWTDWERTERTARSVCESDSIQYNALANGVELSLDDLQMLGKGLVSIVALADGAPYGTPGNRSLDPGGCPKNQSGSGVQVSHVPVHPRVGPEHTIQGEAHLGKDETNAHRLLLEFTGCCIKSQNT